jgi:uncharacterized protein YxeA
MDPRIFLKRLRLMKRILPLILSGTAFIMAFSPALKAQEINIGPNGITVHRHHRYSEEERERQQWEQQHRYSQDYYERQRERQREAWRERFYERNGYYPD